VRWADLAALEHKMDITDTDPDKKTIRSVQAGVPLVVSEEEAIDWLNGYKSAWEIRDVEAATALFAPEASYRERRFAEPLLGHKTLESYWRDRVFEHQRDIVFDFELWGVRGNELMAHWQASFTWLPINGIMRIDGVMNVKFSGRKNGRLVGMEFNEWFDLIEVR
jgi:hypothetical protein